MKYREMIIIEDNGCDLKENRHDCLQDYVSENVDDELSVEEYKKELQSYDIEPGKKIGICGFDHFGIVETEDGDGIKENGSATILIDNHGLIYQLSYETGIRTIEEFKKDGMIDIGDSKDKKFKEMCEKLFDCDFIIIRP